MWKALDALMQVGPHWAIRFGLIGLLVAFLWGRVAAVERRVGMMEPVYRALAKDLCWRYPAPVQRLFLELPCDQLLRNAQPGGPP